MTLFGSGIVAYVRKLQRRELPIRFDAENFHLLHHLLVERGNRIVAIGYRHGDYRRISQSRESFRPEFKNLLPGAVVGHDEAGKANQVAHECRHFTCRNRVGADEHVRDLEDGELRDDGGERSARRALQQEPRRGALLLVSIHEEGDEDIRIDQDLRSGQTRPRRLRALAISFTTSPEELLTNPSHRKNAGRSVEIAIFPPRISHVSLSPTSRLGASRTSLGTVSLIGRASGGVREY